MCGGWKAARSWRFSSTVTCFALARLCNLVRSALCERTFEQCSPSRLRRTARAQQDGARASAQVA
jgi:hypothetical protein